MKDLDKDYTPLPANANEENQGNRKVFFQSTLAKPQLVTATVADMQERVKALLNVQIQHLERRPSSALDADDFKVLIAINSALIVLADDERKASRDAASSTAGKTEEQLREMAGLV